MARNSEIIVFCFILISVIIMLAACTVTSASDKRQIKTWLCYYGNTFGPDIYSRFDLVVFDGNYHPPLPDKKKKGNPIILGYVSIGEIGIAGPFWDFAKDKSYLIKKNEFWDSWIVDVRDPLWHELLFNRIIPAVLDKGFDGLFLDTFDSALYLLQSEYGDKFAGIESALVKITKRIKTEYPGKFIAVNRGLPVLPAIARNIDFVIVEDCYSYYAGHDKGYIRVDRNSQNILLDQISNGLRINPDLTVLTLDYATADQTGLIEEAISFSKKRGFIPYVSTYKLDQIFFHTLGN